jgi:trimeric autotransporter adhesin
MKTILNILYPVFAMFALAYFEFSPTAKAVSSPPDGCYPAYTTAEGCNALKSLTTGAANTAVGALSLLSDTTGNYNTAVGTGTLLLNTADSNTAVGTEALLLNTTGTGNTAIGFQALLNNTTGGGPPLDTNGRNTAVGFQALYSNTTGFANTANGDSALYSNTTGYRNTATGVGALQNDTTGYHNTATGHAALASNTTGIRNTADGKGALVSNTTGSFNVATGNAALDNNTTGSKNIALGFFTGCHLTAGDNNIDIGNLGVDGDSNTIRIGTVVAEDDCIGFTTQPAHTTTYIAGIYGQTASGGVPVYINSDGKLGTLTSSARFKKDVEPMDRASEAVLALNPVTFRYKKELDPKGIPQFGLIAEDVAKVEPSLVTRDRNGEIYSVRYEAVNAMLLNEFLKEHRTVQEQGAMIARQQRQIEALTAGLQKVSAQIQASKPAPQVVNNP